MKIKALAPWYGAKRTLAPKIVEALGPHSAYWEPFCGSMAVLLAKPECRMETVCDLHGDITNLALVIQHADLGARFYRRARRLIVGDDQLRISDAAVRAGDFEGDSPDLDRALAFFASSWMGRNGEVGLAKTERGRYLAVRFTPNGGDPATRVASAVESIPAWRRRMRNVTVLSRNRDGFEVLKKIGDDAGTVIYCDPPYLSKSDTYLYDFEAADHATLAGILHRFKKARVVVSYYHHPRLGELYRGWRVIDCSMTKAMANTNVATGKRTAPEVLLVNERTAGLFA